MQWVVGIAIGLYISSTLLLNIPFVQRQLSALVAHELSATLGSELTIGRIDMGLLNRIIVENLLLKDHSGDEMLRVTRLSAKFEILPLLRGKISIRSVQLFGFNIRLNKETPQAKPNYQFVLDAFAPKDTIKKETNLDLRINSVLIRRGRLSYDVLSEEETPGRFNPKHIRLHNIIANISLKALQNDSINAAIKRLSVDDEHSGFSLKKLTLKAVGGNKGMNIENFAIALPHTELTMDTIRLTYDSIASFTRFSSDVHFAFRLKPSQVVLQDIAPFVPVLANFHEPLLVETSASGTADRLNCPKLSITSGNRFRLLGDVTLSNLSDTEQAAIAGKLSTLYASPEGVAFLVRNLSREYNGVPKVLKNLGTVSFTGDISGRFSHLATHGEVRTDCGEVLTDLTLQGNREQGYMAYTGEVQTPAFQLGKMLGNKNLGSVTFNLHVDSHHPRDRRPTVYLEGLVAAIDYNGYNYENITLDGEYKQGGFHGQVTLDDPNGFVQLSGSINTSQRTPTFNFLAQVDHLRPRALNLVKDYDDAEVSVKIKADFTGSSIDDMNGEINVDSLLYDSPQKQYLMRNLKFLANGKRGETKRLSIESDFLRGNIEGNYSYQTLPASLTSILQRYLPALMQKEKRKQRRMADNNFRFRVELFDTEMLSTVFRLPLTVYAHSSLTGYFNDLTRRLRIEGYFPRFRYKERFIESAMLLCENPADRFRARVRFNERKKNGALSVSLDATALNDSLQATVNWGNSSSVTYSGKLGAMAHFIRNTKTHKSPLKTVVDLEQSRIILNDTLWHLNPARIVVDSGKVHINNFAFSHNDRHLHINGTVSSSMEDTLHLELNKINIGYVFEIANLGVDFSGEATGPATGSGLLGKEPAMQTDLFIRNLGLNNGLLGDAHIHGEWHNEVKGIHLDADIREGNIAHSLVDGYIYPLKPTSALDLQIKADSTNLKFIHYYLSDLTPDFNGRASGDVRLYGKFKALTLNGRVRADASLEVDVLNTTYQLKDSVILHPGGLVFYNNRLLDRHGHEARVNGYVNYEHFKNIAYNFDFNYDNMLVMDLPEAPDSPFYGTVYGTGSATIAGNALDGVNIDVAVTPQRNTTFTYIKDYVSTAVSNQFIRFADKTPRRAVLDSVRLSDFEAAQLRVLEEKERESDTDIRLNLLVDATPDATMRIIMDPVAGDYISARGSGNIRTEFYNKGDIRMFGAYNINQGVYKFSLQEVIRKDFNIREGSSLAFNGNPEEATLDIHATYTVNSASLNDLMPSEATTGYINQTNVKVNCLLALTGPLTNPVLSFDLELPTERDEVQALVRNYIPTDEQMNMQILYLLAIGKFYTQENVGATQNSNVMSSVVSSTLSGQLNNALSNILNVSNWNFGTNFSTGERGWTDVEFETMLSGQLLNNRLLINGNFGYRDNPMANTNFVGDFEAEWLVTRSGDIRLKAYNETNDRYYTRTNLTTQGVGIIFKKDFDRWSELWFWNRWKVKQLQKRLEKKK